MDHRHPSEAPTRQHAAAIVFHLADMENCDTAYVSQISFLSCDFESSNRAVQIFYELLEAYKVRA